MSDKHYFASSVFGWGVGDTEDEALDNCIAASPYYPYHASVIEVPLHRDAPYKISDYVPEVDDIHPLYRVVVEGRKEYTVEGPFVKGDDGIWRVDEDA
jgi:hypothetical protein